MKNPDAGPDHAAHQHDEGDARLPHAQLGGQPLDRIGRVGVHLAIAGLPGPAGGGEDLRGGQEFHHQPVDRRSWFHRPTSGPCAPGSKARVSDIERIGRKRANNRKATRNTPSEPR